MPLNQTLDRNLATFAALNGAMAVAVGAFAAHNAGPQIKTLLTTGAHYQIVHAMLALICALVPFDGRLSSLAGWLASIGGLIFCLSLALLGFLSTPAIGALTPIGGVLMIAAWLLLAFAAFRNPTSKA